MRQGVVLRFSYTHQSRIVGFEVPWPTRDYRKVLVKVVVSMVGSRSVVNPRVLNGARARNTFMAGITIRSIIQVNPGK